MDGQVQQLRGSEFSVGQFGCEMRERGLLMHRDRIKQTSANPDSLERTTQILTARRAHGVLMKYGVLSFQIRGEQESGCRESSMIAKRMRPPNPVLRIEVG